MKLATVEALINNNNMNAVQNAEKDRIRTKVRQDEYLKLEKEFNDNIRNPDHVDETVRDEVNNALLRMTEKKMMADDQVRELNARC